MERMAIPMEPYGAAMAEKGTEIEPLLDKTNKMSHNHDPIPPCQQKKTHNSVPNSSHRAHSGLMERTAIPMEPYGAAMAEKGTEKEPLLDKTKKMSHNHDPIPPCQQRNT